MPDTEAGFPGYPEVLVPVVLADLSVLDHNDLMYHVFNGIIMRNNKHRSAILSVDILQQYQDVPGSPGIQRTRRLIA